jgi:hypothetical protein
MGVSVLANEWLRGVGEAGGKLGEDVDVGLERGGHGDVKVGMKFTDAEQF